MKTVEKSQEVKELVIEHLLRDKSVIPEFLVSPIHKIMVDEVDELLQSVGLPTYEDYIKMVLATEYDITGEIFNVLNSEFGEYPYIIVKTDLDRKGKEYSEIKIQCGKAEYLQEELEDLQCIVNPKATLKKYFYNKETYTLEEI